jgi:hypothetical protein
VIQQKFEAYPGYSNIAKTGNVLLFCKILRTSTTKRRFHNFHQLQNQSVQAYFEYFQNQVDVVTHIGGVLRLDPTLIKRGAEELGKEEENMSEMKKDC